MVVIPMRHRWQAKRRWEENTTKIQYSQDQPLQVSTTALTRLYLTHPLFSRFSLSTGPAFSGHLAGPNLNSSEDSKTARRDAEVANQKYYASHMVFSPVCLVG